jgi:hypothetical protein
MSPKNDTKMCLMSLFLGTKKCLHWCWERCIRGLSKQTKGQHTMSTQNIITGHELALYVINIGGPEETRKNALGKTSLIDANKSERMQMNAEAWTRVASDGARRYEMHFGCYSASCFTPQEIIRAALELCDYYQHHAMEIQKIDINS